MRLDGWRIDGFGGLAGWQVETLAEHDLVVVCGPNESGKSTLREFIATAYFGFAPAQRELHPFAPDDGRFGGALQLVDDEGERLSIERELRSAPRGRVYRATTHDDLANRPLPALAGISGPSTSTCTRSAWPSCCASTRPHGSRSRTASWPAPPSRSCARPPTCGVRSTSRPPACGAPTGAVSPRRGGCATASRSSARSSGRPAAARRRLDDIDGELAGEREREEQLRRTASALVARLRRHTDLAPALAAWRDVERLRAEAAAILPRDDDFPGDPADAVDRRRAEAADAERAATTARRQADQLQALADVPARGAACWPSARGELRELAAEESGAADLRAAIGAAEAALRARRAEVDRRAHAVLGRPLEPADRVALDTVRSADLRAAVTAAAVPARRSPVVRRRCRRRRVGAARRRRRRRANDPGPGRGGAGRRGRAAGAVGRAAAQRAECGRGRRRRWTSHRRGWRCPTRACRPTSTTSGPRPPTPTTRRPSCTGCARSQPPARTGWPRPSGSSASRPPRRRCRPSTTR